MPSLHPFDCLCFSVKLFTAPSPTPHREPCLAPPSSLAQGGALVRRSFSPFRDGASGIDAHAMFINQRNSQVGCPGAYADVAEVVSYLADEKADYVTGQTLVVDGGVIYT